MLVNPLRSIDELFHCFACLRKQSDCQCFPLIWAPVAETPGTGPAAIPAFTASALDAPQSDLLALSSIPGGPLKVENVTCVQGADMSVYASVGAPSPSGPFDTSDEESEVTTPKEFDKMGFPVSMASKAVGPTVLAADTTRVQKSAFVAPAAHTSAVIASIANTSAEAAIVAPYQSDLVQAITSSWCARNAAATHLSHAVYLGGSTAPPRCPFAAARSGHPVTGHGAVPRASNLQPPFRWNGVVTGQRTVSTGPVVPTTHSLPGPALPSGKPSPFIARTLPETASIDPRLITLTPPQIPDVPHDVDMDCDWDSTSDLSALSGVVTTKQVCDDAPETLRSHKEEFVRRWNRYGFPDLSVPNDVPRAMASETGAEDAMSEDGEGSNTPCGWNDEADADTVDRTVSGLVLSHSATNDSANRDEEQLRAYPSSPSSVASDPVIRSSAMAIDRPEWHRVLVCQRVSASLSRVATAASSTRYRPPSSNSSSSLSSLTSSSLSSRHDDSPDGDEPMQETPAPVVVSSPQASREERNRIFQLCFGDEDSDLTSDDEE